MRGRRQAILVVAVGCNQSRGLTLFTEAFVDVAYGVHHCSVIRCDFLMLMFKRRLTRFVTTLLVDKIRELDRALVIALELTLSQSASR